MKQMKTLTIKGNTYEIVDAESRNRLDNINSTVDQTYNPESASAQSGIAVAEALELNKEVVNISSIDVVYNSVDELPATASNGTRLPVLSDGALPVKIYSFDSNSNAWEYTATVKGSTLYCVLTNNKIYRFTMASPYFIEMGKTEVDKTYNSESENAQSGKAVAEALAKLTIPEDYITESELEAKGYLTEHQSLAGLATEEFVTTKITEAKLEGGDVDLSGYALKSEVDAKIIDLVGNDSNAVGDASFAQGIKKDRKDAPDEPADSDWRYPEAIGTASLASGYGPVAYARSSKSIGYRSQTGLPASEEEWNKRPEAKAALYNSKTGKYVFLERDSDGNILYPEDMTNLVWPAENHGQAATAIGSDTAALIMGDFAGGRDSVARGGVSMAFGRDNDASGYAAVALGWNTKAEGEEATALGLNNEAKGNRSFVGGSENKAKGQNSVVFGMNNESPEKSVAQTVIGKFNEYEDNHIINLVTFDTQGRVNIDNKSLFSVGDGGAVLRKTGDRVEIAPRPNKDSGVRCYWDSITVPEYGDYIFEFEFINDISADAGGEFGFAFDTAHPNISNSKKYSWSGDKPTKVYYEVTLKKGVAYKPGIFTGYNDGGTTVANLFYLCNFKFYKKSSISKDKIKDALLIIGNGDNEENRSNAFVVGENAETTIGNDSRALGTNSFAQGEKRAISGDFPLDENGEEIIPDEAWRNLEAIGTASMAAGMGGVAYSRASKSLGYRTQTGVPASEEEWNRRPEATAVLKHKENGSLYFLTRNEDGSINYPADIDNYEWPKDNFSQAAVAIGADTVALSNHSFAGGINSMAAVANGFSFGNGNKVYSKDGAAIGGLRNIVKGKQSGNAVVGERNETGENSGWNFLAGHSNKSDMLYGFGAGYENELRANAATVLGFRNKSAQGNSGFAQTVIGKYNDYDLQVIEEIYEEDLITYKQGKPYVGGKILSAAGDIIVGEDGRLSIQPRSGNTSGNRCWWDGMQVEEDGEYVFEFKIIYQISGAEDAKGKIGFAMGTDWPNKDQSAIYYDWTNYNEVSIKQSATLQAGVSYKPGIFTSDWPQCSFYLYNMKFYKKGSIKLITKGVIDNALFVVGNGTSDTNRDNAFIVYKDGSATIKTGGISDNSVVNYSQMKTYVNEATTSIDNVLKDILSAIREHTPTEETVANIEQIIVSYLENKTVAEVEV